MDNQIDEKTEIKTFMVSWNKETEIFWKKQISVQTQHANVKLTIQSAQIF